VSSRRLQLLRKGHAFKSCRQLKSISRSILSQTEASSIAGCFLRPIRDWCMCSDCPQIFHQWLSGIASVSPIGSVLMSSKCWSRTVALSWYEGLGQRHNSLHRCHQLRPIRLLACNASIGQLLQKHYRFSFSEAGSHMVDHFAYSRV
jgi:hypothetical protein